MTSWVSADFASHKVAVSHTHRGNVAAGSLITLWGCCALLEPGGGVRASTPLVKLGVEGLGIR